MSKITVEELRNLLEEYLDLADAAAQKADYARESRQCATDLSYMSASNAYAVAAILLRRVLDGET